MIKFPFILLYFFSKEKVIEIFQFSILISANSEFEFLEI